MMVPAPALAPVVSSAPGVDIWRQGGLGVWWLGCGDWELGRSRERARERTRGTATWSLVFDVHERTNEQPNPREPTTNPSTHL